MFYRIMAISTTPHTNNPKQRPSKLTNPDTIHSDIYFNYIVEYSYDRTCLL